MHVMDGASLLPEFLVRLPEGVIRVVGTRVSVDSVVRSFHEGASPEEICLDFPSLDLARVYSVLAHYLTHREVIDAYLSEQQRSAEVTRQESRARHGAFLSDLRQRVTSRRDLPPART